MQAQTLPPIRLPQAKNDLNLRLICKFCRDKVPNLIEDWKTGDMVCGNCGLVIGPRIIDTSSEWRTFANSDEADGDPSRVGSVRDSLLGPGLDSLMIGTSKTGLGKDLQKTNNKIAHDRNVQTLLTAFKDIQHLTDLISLPRVVTDTIKRYYKKVMDENIARGKSQEAIKAACIFIACKEHNSARTFKEICNLTKVSKKELGRTYKQIRSLLTVDEGEISYESHVHRVSSQLDLPQDVVSSAVKVFKLNKLIKKVRTLGYLDGKSPITVVATCLYYCSLLTEEPMSAREIADASMCTEATLKNAYRILYEHRVDLRDEVATLKYTVGDLVY